MTNNVGSTFGVGDTIRRCTISTYLLKPISQLGQPIFLIQTQLGQPFIFQTSIQPQLGQPIFLKPRSSHSQASPLFSGPRFSHTVGLVDQKTSSTSSYVEFKEASFFSKQSYFILVKITHRQRCLIHVACHSLPTNRHHPLFATHIA